MTRLAATVLPSRRSSWRRTVGLISVPVAVGLLLGGCASADVLQPPTSAARYTSGDAVTEIPVEERSDALVFSGVLETGQAASSADWAAKVVVANFWYAACGPCRAEAPDLAALDKQFTDDVVFVGVNVRDQPATAASFASKFEITYPSFIDADTGQVQLAFAGQVAPNAVPSTVVLDRQGRPAARIIGQLDRSVLETLITDAVGEPR